MLQQMHALGRYFKNEGVTGILVDETRNVTGEFRATMENVSYLADNILFLRHLEVDGEIRKSIGVLKKRTSDFERTIREFRITEHGVTVGEPMSGLRGILSGTPEVVERDAERDSRGRDE
jgi:circadian clock protein KaiC